MTLTCGPPEDIDLGGVLYSEWKFQGRKLKDSERMRIEKSSTQSMLTISNIILNDIGKSKLTNFENSCFYV